MKIINFFKIIFDFIKSFLFIRKNNKIDKLNKSTVINEIKKTAQNANSTDENIKNKAIDDMRKLISD